MPRLGPEPGTRRCRLKKLFGHAVSFPCCGANESLRYHRSSTRTSVTSAAALRTLHSTSVLYTYGSCLVCFSRVVSCYICMHFCRPLLFPPIVVRVPKRLHNYHIPAQSYLFLFYALYVAVGNFASTRRKTHTLRSTVRTCHTPTLVNFRHFFPGTQVHIPRGAWRSGGVQKQKNTAQIAFLGAEIFRVFGFSFEF